MIRINITVICFTILFSSCHSSKKSTVITGDQIHPPASSASVNYADPVTWLLGYINPGQFTNFPHSEWYHTGFDGYQPDNITIEKLRELNMEDLSVKIVLGTWCPDSRRELPRFMKVLSTLQFPREKVLFIGVDNSKIAPVGEYDQLGIERVPTFIFLKNNVEAGRIIENPVTSLEQDMLNILTRNEK